MPVVLNATMARDLFGNEPAVDGHSTLIVTSGMATFSSPARVIGVAGDTRSGAVRLAPRPAVYTARTPTYRYGTILVRSDEPIGMAMMRIRAVVREVDPALPITTLRLLEETVAEELSQDRVLARLSAVVGLLAAWLAATGVIAVIGQLVIERTRDFGIRTALGASSADIMRSVINGVVPQSAMGAVLGLSLYWGISRWLETRLFELEALDPATIAAAVAALLGIVLVAALVPAWRAASIDPVVALRAD